MYPIQRFTDEYAESLLSFLQSCLPESGRQLDLKGRHKIYLDIRHSFEAFWIMLDSGEIIGTAALKRLDEGRCELKSLYLYERYQGRGLGRTMLDAPGIDNGIVLKKVPKDLVPGSFVRALVTSAKAYDITAEITAITSKGKEIG